MVALEWFWGDDDTCLTPCPIARPHSPASPVLDSFYRVRPVVETGWEVMLINRALQEGRYDASTILRDYTVRFGSRGAGMGGSILIDRPCTRTLGLA